MTKIKSPFKLQVESSLARQGMTPEAIAEYRDKNWTFFLRNCRRLVPDPKRLLERFDSVIEMFRDVVDAKTGEVLLRPKAMHAVKQLRKHIQDGCLSDPEHVPLYYTTGRNAAGITTRRCVRGTNCTEVPVFVRSACAFISSFLRHSPLLVCVHGIPCTAGVHVLIFVGVAVSVVFRGNNTNLESLPFPCTVLQGLSPLPSQAAIVVLCISCAGSLRSPRVQLPLERQDGCEEPRPTTGGWRVLRSV